jgi:hypothetical protein
MITTKQEKDKTTIVIPRRLRKAEIARVVNYLSYPEIMPKKNVTKKQIQKLADEINVSISERFKKLRNTK